jgi:hypothetical protein
MGKFTLAIMQIHTNPKPVRNGDLIMPVGMFRSIRSRTERSGNANLCFSLDFLSWRAMNRCLYIAAIHFQFDAIVNFIVHIAYLVNFLLQHVSPPKDIKGCLDDSRFAVA